jgi:hypothetical protein
LVRKLESESKRGQFVEELFKLAEVGGVECRAALCADAELACNTLESFGIARGEDQMGSFGDCETCCFQANASTTADHNYGLPGKRGLTPDGRRSACSAHGFLQSAV